jgi:hypothetical protein
MPRYQIEVVVSLTSRPLYPCGKKPRYPTDTKLGRPQSWSGYGGEEKNPSICQKSNIGPAHSLDFNSASPDSTETNSYGIKLDEYLGHVSNLQQIVNHLWGGFQIARSEARPNLWLATIN